jgi:glycosyltransferase involved in cell wall biosynthesis
MKKKLVIIIPAYNEEISISKVIKNIPDIKGLNQEVIVIDDGSIDQTRIEAIKFGAVVYSNETNLGLGTSFKKGIAIALEKEADIIVNIDADYQYDPRYIPSLVKILENEDVDLVIGNRFIDDKELGHNFIKRWGNRVISVFISKVLLRQKEIFDIQSGFRAFNKDLAEFLVKMLSGKYTYTQEMMIVSCLHKFKIEQVSIKFYKRTAGESRLIKNPFIYLIKILFITFKTYFRSKIKIMKQ